MVKQSRSGNVAPLDPTGDGKAVEGRQKDVANACLSDIGNGDPERRPVAFAGVFISPSGRIKIRMVGIEPEYAEPLLRSIDAIRERLQQFIAEQPGMPQATVIPIKP